MGARCLGRVHRHVSGGPGGPCGQRAWVCIAPGDLPAESPGPLSEQPRAAVPARRGVLGPAGRAPPGRAGQGQCLLLREALQTPRTPTAAAASTARRPRGIPGPSGNHVNGTGETGEASDPTSRVAVLPLTARGFAGGRARVHTDTPRPGPRQQRGGKWGSERTFRQRLRRPPCPTQRQPPRP